MSLIWEKLSLCCHRRHSRLKTLFPQKVKQEKVGQIFSTCRRSQTVSGRRPFVSFHHLSSKKHLSWPLLSLCFYVFKNKCVQKPLPFIHVFRESFPIACERKTHICLKLNTWNMHSNENLSKHFWGCCGLLRTASLPSVKVLRIQLFSLIWIDQEEEVLRVNVIPLRTETRGNKNQSGSHRSLSCLHFRQQTMRLWIVQISRLAITLPNWKTTPVSLPFAVQRLLLSAWRFFFLAFCLQCVAVVW